jgi:hypothetical protein
VIFGGFASRAKRGNRHSGVAELAISFVEFALLMFVDSPRRLC